MIHLILSLWFSLSGLVFAKDDKDWTLDLKTSTLIPKYSGIVKEVKGMATIEDSELKNGSKIYPQDIIKTKEKSFVKLELVDDSLVTIGPLSEFQIESWVYRTKNDRDAIYSLLKGRMRMEIKSKAKDRDQLKVKSSLVAMGIRGTSFALNNSLQGNKEVAQISLMEGAIRLTSSEFKETINMKPGDYIEIVKGLKKSRHALKPLPAADFERLKRPQQPDEIQLLDELVLNDADHFLDIEDAHSPEAASHSLAPSESEEESTSKRTAQEPESVKNKLKLLNSIREENRKK